LTPRRVDAVPHMSPRGHVGGTGPQQAPAQTVTSGASARSTRSSPPRPPRRHMSCPPAAGCEFAPTTRRSRGARDARRSGSTRGSRMGAMTATLRDTVSRAVCDAIQPGAVELCDAIEELLPGAGDGPGSVERIKPDVCRLRAGSDGRERSFVLKRFDPWQARRAELVARRWLPAFGLGDRCPQLLATAADRRGQWTWHVYQDLGDGGIDPVHPDRGQVEAVVDLIAELHTRAAGHALLPECRRYCGDLGAPFFAAAVRDAIATLEALDRKSTRLNSSHVSISYAVFCLKKKIALPFNSIYSKLRFLA